MNRWRHRESSDPIGSYAKLAWTFPSMKILYNVFMRAELLQYGNLDEKLIYALILEKRTIQISIATLKGSGSTVDNRKYIKRHKGKARRKLKSVT